MFCPKCGSDGQSANSYCKRCGQWITGGEGRTWYDSGEMSPDRTLKVLGAFNVLGAVLAFACGVALFAALMTKKGVYFFGGLVSIYCILLAAFQVLTYVGGRRLRRRLEAARGTESKELRGGAPALGAADTAPFGASPSVSERTTELLEPLPARPHEGGEPR
jgi:hypothetical protein